jgi:hypothetical protein
MKSLTEFIADGMFVTALDFFVTFPLISFLFLLGHVTQKFAFLTLNLSPHVKFFPNE